MAAPEKEQRAEQHQQRHRLRDDAGPHQHLAAVRAAESKKATDIRVLDLTGITAFTDYFVICTGSNSRQIQSIADEIELRLKKLGERAISIEGYENAEWVLMDYGDYLIHIFSEKSRSYYDLERLWRDTTPSAPDQAEWDVVLGRIVAATGRRIDPDQQDQ